MVFAFLLLVVACGKLGHLAMLSRNGDPAITNFEAKCR